MARVGDAVDYSVLGNYFKTLIRNNTAIVRAVVDQSNRDKEVGINNVVGWVAKQEDLIGTAITPLASKINILS